MGDVIYLCVSCLEVYTMSKDRLCCDCREDTQGNWRVNEKNTDNK